jgi:hypothetical protein
MTAATCSFETSVEFKLTTGRYMPITVAERSKAWTVFVRADAGTMGSNTTQGMDVYCLCCVCVFLCLCTGRGLAMSWSPIQGVLLTVLDLVTEVKRKVSWRWPRPELGYCAAFWDPSKGEVDTLPLQLRKILDPRPTFAFITLRYKNRPKFTFTHAQNTTASVESHYFVVIIDLRFISISFPKGKDSLSLWHIFLRVSVRDTNSSINSFFYLTTLGVSDCRQLMIR